MTRTQDTSYVVQRCDAGNYWTNLWWYSHLGAARKQMSVEQGQFKAAKFRIVKRVITTAISTVPKRK